MHTMLRNTSRTSAFSLDLLVARTSRIRSLSTSTLPPTSPASAIKHNYTTTPIFYVNADPHIGHLHSTLLADVYSRWSSLRHPDAPKPILCTGTDEHGLKIQRVAEGKGVHPKVLCDSVSERFRELTKAANIGNDIFIRTTEDRHRVAVEHVWRRLNEKGFIYKSSYAGWYAVSDEAYYSAAQVHEVAEEGTGTKIMVSIETGTKVEWMEEENYKFRLSAFREPLLAWLNSTPAPLQPISRTTALVASLVSSTSSDLQDLSISRPSSRLSWGIAVPGDADHTIYVWIDALVNYLTAAGYPWKGGEAYTEPEVWPPELMVVGKDIIRFHALYLPAVLMALDLPLPTTILAHGHWTMDKHKMSKSRGNVANPFDAMKTWGVDAMRAYLMRAGGNSAADADYSPAGIEEFYRKDLAGTMGNLVSRITTPKLIARLPSPAALYTAPDVVDPTDEELLQELKDLPSVFEAHMAAFAPNRAVNSIISALSTSNRHLQHISPWLITATPTDVHRALYYSSEALRIAGILLRPFMPTKSIELLEGLGVEGRGWADAQVGSGGVRVPSASRSQLFPRVVAVQAGE